MAQHDSEDETRPAPPQYTSITGSRAEQATRVFEGDGVITPEQAETLSIGAAIDKAYADFSRTVTMDDIRNGGPSEGAMYFHSQWLSIDDAATAVEEYPEVPKTGFYPPEVADTLRELPDDALVSLGRENVPALYVFTNRPPMVAMMKDAGQNAVVVEVVEDFPHEGDGESVLRYSGEPGGEWLLTRVQWYQ